MIFEVDKTNKINETDKKRLLKYGIDESEKIEKITSKIVITEKEIIILGWRKIRYRLPRGEYFYIPSSHTSRHFVILKEILIVKIEGDFYEVYIRPKVLYKMNMSKYKNEEFFKLINILNSDIKERKKRKYINFKIEEDEKNIESLESDKKRYEKLIFYIFCLTLIPIISFSLLNLVINFTELEIFSNTDFVLLSGKWLTVVTIIGLLIFIFKRKKK